MQMDISRSEKKRQAARVEKLAAELTNLGSNEINALPIDPMLKGEIKAAGKLDGGARKRLVKYIAKELRERDEEYRQLADFLARRKGSKLKENEEFHELENLRQAIISDAIAAQEEARAADLPLTGDWPSPGLEEVRRLFPELDHQQLRTLAGRFARNRKVAHSREIFRQLKSAKELQARREAMTP